MSVEGSENTDVSNWIDAILPRALAFARSLTSDFSLAEDLVHDCLLRLWTHRDRYDLIRDGQRLLLKAIANAAVDRYRRTAREHSDETVTLGQTSVASDETEPIAALLLLETESVVNSALARLSMNQRAALQLSSEGFALKEIAESLNVSEQNAGVLVYRARKAMEELLGPYLNEGYLGQKLR